MSHRRWVQLALTLALVLAAGGAWAHWRMVCAGQATLAELESQAQAMQQAVNEDTLHQQADALRRELTRYESALPVEGEVANVLERLSHDLIGLGVTDRSVVTGVGATLGPVRHVPVHVTFQGSFASVHELLERIGAYPRLMRTGRLVIRRQAGAPAEALTIMIRLDTYSRVMEARP